MTAIEHDVQGSYGGVARPKALAGASMFVLLWNAR